MTFLILFCMAYIDMCSQLTKDIKMKQVTNLSQWARNQLSMLAKFQPTITESKDLARRKHLDRVINNDRTGLLFDFLKFSQPTSISQATSDITKGNQNE